MTKLFFGDCDDEVEVFLNFNLAIRKGQFSAKDPEYGDQLLKDLAKVP